MYRLPLEHTVTESKEVLNTHTPETYTHTHPIYMHTPHTCIHAHTATCMPHTCTPPPTHHTRTPPNTHTHATHTHTAMEYVKIRSQPKELRVAKAGIVRHRDD